MVYVDLHFPFVGTTLPTDHGYALYGAVSRLIPDAHEADWLSIETIPGIARGDGITQLDPQANLKMRLPQEHVPALLKLAGKQLVLDGHALRLGAPQISLLAPSPQLYSRIVTIKGFTEADPFRAAVCRKLDEMGLKGEPAVGPRRKVRIGNHIIVGFAVAIHELSEDASIALQEHGLGGRRKMGCGIFYPISINCPIGERFRHKEEVSRAE